jgi:dTDP-4-dehydrorhamnose reductase
VKILLTGRSGQLGWELNRMLAPLGEVLAPDRTQLDLARPDQIAAAVRSARPDVIVNAAAYTSVDLAETETDRAHLINATAPGLLAEEARRCGALCVHYSTDYVFDGTKTAPYLEEDTPNPINTYGRSKLAGENAIRSAGCPYLIFRTSWVYAARGRNFFLTIRRLLREKEQLSVVSDQIGAPTSASALAEATARVLHRRADALGDARGVYHATASGSTSWHGFASEIARLEGFDAAARIRPILSSEYPTAALRPANSRLSNKRLLEQFGVALPGWEKSLQACLETLRNPGRTT